MKKKKRTNRRPQKLQQNIRNTLSGHRTAKKKSDKPSQEGEAASNAPGIKRKKKCKSNNRKKKKNKKKKKNDSTQKHLRNQKRVDSNIRRFQSNVKNVLIQNAEVMNR